MTTTKTLRFRARGTALVQDFEKLDAGIRRFVGRKYTEVEPGVFGFVPTGHDDVPDRAEYRKACADGDLWAADEATAKACGVVFDPAFGEPKAPPSPPKTTAADAAPDAEIDPALEASTSVDEPAADSAEKV